MERDPLFSKQKEVCPRKGTPLGPNIAGSNSHDDGSMDTDEIQEIRHDNTKQEAWTKVVNRRKLDVTKKTRLQDQAKGPVFRKRNSSDVLIVETPPDKYSEVLKRIKNGANMEVIGNKILGLRQAKSGGILIQTVGGLDAASTVKSEVLRIIDKDARVYSPTKQVLVEFRGLDSLTSKEDLVDEIVRNVDTTQEAIKILSLRETYGETQSALVLMPSDIAAKITERKRMRVGLVYCSTRIRERWKRCFRCLKVGHEAKTCSGPDNSGCCLRCGIAGHRAANCQAGTKEASEFRRSLHSSVQTAGSLGANPVQ